MNRFKFRGWHIDMNKMLYPPKGYDSMILCRDSAGEHVKITIENAIGEKEGLSYPCHVTWDGRQYILGKYQAIIWMQFAGLFDKNQKEIYEGDILQWNNENELYRVEYDKGCFWGVLIQKDWDIESCIALMPEERPYLHTLYPEINMKVIGNIFENPELNIV